MPGAAFLFRWPIVPTAHCSAHMLWDAPILQTSNCSLPPPFLSRWIWTERDGCSFRLFGWLHDFHLFVQTNPNPYPNNNLNQFMPNPNLNLTSVHTLPLSLVPHWFSISPLVHLTACGRNRESAEQWAGPILKGCTSDLKIELWPLSWPQTPVSIIRAETTTAYFQHIHVCSNIWCKEN